MGPHLLTVLIVDDSALIRRTLRSTIERNTTCHVCGEAENGEMAVGQVKKLRPDAVILDFQMPLMNGLEAARQIAKIAPNTAMLLFTMHNSEQLVKDAHAAGIHAVFSKGGGPGQVLAWLNSALVRR